MVIVQVGDLAKKQLDCLIYSLRSIELLQDLAFSSKLLFNCWYFVAYQVGMYNWPVCQGLSWGWRGNLGFLCTSCPLSCLPLQLSCYIKLFDALPVFFMDAV